MNKVEKLDAANKFSPAIVLVISVLLFRCRFNGKQSKKVFAREKVIVVHVVLFLSFVITYASFHILSSYYIKSPFGSMQECRLFVSSSYFQCFYITANVSTLILFIYMSVMFSRPLNGYWKEFLLSYREQTLGEAIQARLPPTEQVRARRSHLLLLYITTARSSLCRLFLRLLKKVTRQSQLNQMTKLYLIHRKGRFQMTHTRGRLQMSFLPR